MNHFQTFLLSDETGSRAQEENKEISTIWKDGSQNNGVLG